MFSEKHNRTFQAEFAMTSEGNSKANKAISECADTALSSLTYVDPKEFYRILRNSYDVKPEEIGQKFEAFNDALKETFGIKQYAIQREIIHILNSRVKAGVYRISDEAEAYLRVSKVFLENGEAQLTRTEVQTRLMDYTMRLHRLLEENRENVEKLKASERLVAIGQTAGMVGHDLRTPLQSVIGEVYLAKTELMDLPDSKQKRKLQECLEFISEQILYMDKVVGDLQAFVAGFSASIREIKLRQLIISTLAQVVIPENVKTTLLVRDDLVLETDPELLKRAITNLIVNSIQAMPQGGELTVKAQSNRSEVSISVEDTGGGIPDHIKPKLFTPLFTTKAKGQGFGLAAVKRIMEALDGTVTFESEVGNGTKFNLTLPSK